MTRRLVSGSLIAVVALVAVFLYLRAQAAEKITICHISKSDGVGYLITVDDDSSQLKGHLNHAGDCVVSIAGPGTPVDVGLPACTTGCPVSPSGH